MTELDRIQANIDKLVLRVQRLKGKPGVNLERGKLMSARNELLRVAQGRKSAT